MPSLQSRRSFLQLVASISGAVLFAFLSGMPAVATADGAQLENLSENEGAELLMLVRNLFPHNTLGDDPYWLVVGRLDAM